MIFRKGDIMNLKLKLAKYRYISYMSEYKEFKEIIDQYDSDNLTIAKPDVWRKSWLKVSKYSKVFLDVGKCFYTTKIRLVKSSEIKDSKLILICVVKDDLNRIKQFVEYYKSIGIEKFAFLDDGSTDGTREFLLGLNFCDIFESDQKYTTNIRQSWINRIIAYYGFNKWYMVADSDELITYNGFEDTSIKKVIESYENHNKLFGRGLMVDMYPSSEIQSDKFEEMNAFDTATYEIRNDILWFKCVSGGMRKRIFSTKEKLVNPYLIKSPLFKATEGFIQINSHYNFPFYYNDQVDFVIRHYKFMKDDFEKFKLRAESENFALGSFEYKAYINKEFDKNLKFYYENSEIYENSSSFSKIDIFDSNDYQPIHIPYKSD